MEGEMITHFSHEHPLTLKAEERKIDDGTNQSVEIIKCDGCSKPMSGPFYSCGECGYYLHKVCAELPKEMNHPLHPQHPLILLSTLPYVNRSCRMCHVICDRFTYNCFECKYNVDVVCASASHTFVDKFHMHPLTPIQHLISIPCCHICQTQEKGLSYKCNICPFWVHQNCTVSLPSNVKHSHHHHVLTLQQMVPPEYVNLILFCDICYNPLSTFHNIYCCAKCVYFAHVNCARSEEASPLLRLRDQNIDGQCVALLPMQQKSTDLISWFVEKYRDRDLITNLILGFDECYIDQDTSVKKEINFFNHEHQLFLIDDQANDVICDSCVVPLSSPSYGCIDCGYFLHKYCTEIPKKILHPSHPQHQISLVPHSFFLMCDCCFQRSNGFGYKCFQCENFYIDIKCASLLRGVKHEDHRHPLIPKFPIPSNTFCTACGYEQDNCIILQCSTCSFRLCFICAMAPHMMKHRYDKHPFILTYSPPENHYNVYICDLCEEDLYPKRWYYHCGLCDQFAHVHCMLFRGAGLNIKYEKRYECEVHEHKLTLVSCTFDTSLCNKCGNALRTGYSVGLKCIPCHYNIHLECALGEPTTLPN